MAGYTINSPEFLCVFENDHKRVRIKTPSNDWNLAEIAGATGAHLSLRASRSKYPGVSSIVPFDPSRARTGPIKCLSLATARAAARAINKCVVEITVFTITYAINVAERGDCARQVKNLAKSKASEPSLLTVCTALLYHFQWPV
jgi:hypothetical protein